MKTQESNSFMIYRLEEAGAGYAEKRNRSRWCSGLQSLLCQTSNEII